MSKVRLAIIGNGMVGHRFIEDLLDKADAEQFDITVFCEEPRKAYDRVHLSSYFSHHTAEELSLVREGFYEKHGVKVLVGERAITINRQEKVIHSSAGRTVFYDKLIMATGSYPWIPPIKGSETQDCFVYRTIEDLKRSCRKAPKRVKPCALQTAASWKWISSSSPPVFARAISWPPSAVWPLRSAAGS